MRCTEVVGPLLPQAAAELPPGYAIQVGGAVEEAEKGNEPERVRAELERADAELELRLAEARLGMLSGYVESVAHFCMGR